MLRPSTPLTVVFLVAFVLLLVSSLSTPVIKGISLAEFDGYHFGVWGFCKDGGECSPIEIGYTVEEIAPTRDGFKLAADTRHSVSYILIVHPIAALFCLICFFLALFSHFRSPSHSVRYQMGMFLMTIPTLLFSLLAFLVDVLLFIPHIKWGGWMVLAATIVILCGSIVTCGMRRTLVSRKAQRKRIAENAEMSGENYFNRQAAKATMPRIESPPPLSGNSVSPLREKAAGFGSFDVKTRRSMDDQRPLNPTSAGGFRTMALDAERNAYTNAPNAANVPNAPMTSRARDPFDNPTSGPYGPNGYRGPASSGSLSSMGAPLPYRGRGAYGAPRGYGPRGGMRGGRGGLNPAYNNGGYAMRGPPQQSWNNNGRGRGGMGTSGRGGMMIGGMLPPQGYDDDIDPYYGNTSDVPATNRSPVPYNGPGRSNSPSPPLPTTTAPSALSGEKISSSNSSLGTPPAQLTDQAYVPPRAQWNTKSPPPTGVPGQRRLSTIQGSPIDLTSSTRVDPLDSYLEDVDPRFAADAEPIPGTLASSNTFPTTANPARASPLPATLIPGSRISPHQDVASSPPPRSAYSGEIPMMFQSSNAYPPPNERNHLMGRNDWNHSQRLLRPPPVGYDSRANFSFDSLPLADGQRSPAYSDGSHYTSISQRGVNPAWRPGFAPKGPGSASSLGRRRGPSREEVLLDTNPDFSLPPGRGGFAGSRARGRGRGNAGVGPGRAGSLPGNLGAPGPYSVHGQNTVRNADGRYPTPI